MSPGSSSITVMGDTFPEGFSVVSLGNRMKTLPSRAASVLELRLIPTLLNKLFWHCLVALLGIPYVLGTVIDQTTTVSFFIILHSCRDNLACCLGLFGIISIKHCYQSVCFLLGILGYILQAYCELIFRLNRQIIPAVFEFKLDCPYHCRVPQSARRFRFVTLGAFQVIVRDFVGGVFTHHHQLYRISRRFQEDFFFLSGR